MRPSACSMRAVWMQRWLRGKRGNSHDPPRSVRIAHKPAYVYAKINSIQQLCRM
jgi:hypothetical protein